jgi:hypothetical protein
MINMFQNSTLFNKARRGSQLGNWASIYFRFMGGLSGAFFYPREHAMLARVYILLFVVVVVVVVVDALLNYCEFRHGCTSSRLLRISSWLQVG